jgi:hypothetical protein
MKQLRIIAAVLSASALSACGDSPSTPSVPAAIQASGSLPAGVLVGSTLSPSVRVTDVRGRAVTGVAVTFQVTAGGGSVSDGSVSTGLNGVATLPAWVIGSIPGPNTLVASHGSLPPVTFTVTGSDTDIQKFAGDSTTCPAGTTGCRFTVRVRGINGAAVPGATVTWTGPGGATATTTTSQNGYASAANLGANGATGAFTQTARLQSSGAEVTFSYALVQGGQYNIDLRPVGTIDPAYQAALDAARTRWQQAITGNLPAITVNRPANSACEDKDGNKLIDHPAINETVDDLLIFVQIVPIDGPGGILGQAGPCLVRSTGSSAGLPVVGMIRLDAADVAATASNGTLGDVMLHELAHVLGFGQVWSLTDYGFNFLQGTGTGGNPHFTGPRARPGFVLAGGTLINNVGVPVEDTGDEGTRLSHWRESVMSTELMTGFINPQTQGNPLSVITIGSLMDLGYQVNFGAADAYLLPGASAALRLDDGPRVELLELPPPVPRGVF